MKTIEISEEFKNSYQITNALHHIANLIERGYTRGYEPDWSLSGEDEEDIESWLDDPFSTPDQD